MQTLCEPHRKFIQEGNLKEDGDQFLFLLFNDLLLKVKEKKEETLKLMAQITLKTATVVDVQDDPEKSMTTLTLTPSIRAEKFLPGSDTFKDLYVSNKNSRRKTGMAAYTT